MDISFADIARLSATMQDDDTLLVNEQGKMMVGKLGEYEVQGLAPEALPHALTSEEVFGALERATSKAFVDEMRKGLAEEKPITAYTIRQVVEKSKAEIEVESHLRNLTSGLQVRDDRVGTWETLQSLISPLLKDARLVAAIDMAKCSALKAACERVDAAKTALKGTEAEPLAELVAAESDLAEELRTFAASVRACALDGMEEQSKSLLEALDDWAMATELNAVKIENVAATLAKIKEDEKAAATAELDRLVGGGTQAAQLPTEAIEAFKKAVRPFLNAVARLDTAEAKADAPALLSAIQAEYANAEHALGLLKAEPHLDARALGELETNLAQLKARAAHVAGSVQETMVRRSINGILAMIQDGNGAAKGFLDQGMHRSWTWLQPLATNLKNFEIALVKELKKLDHDPAALREALEDRKSVLTRKINQLDRFIQLNTQFVKMVGLGDFTRRLAQLRELVQNRPFESAVANLDARHLGEVLRGEIDLENYLGLKLESFPEEMFRADLDGAHAQVTGHAGAGGFNSVDFYTIPNVRTQMPERFVVKNFELSQDVSATCGVGANFSSAQHARHVAKLNYASWKGAHLIGCGSAVTSSGVVRINGRYQLVQEVAPGKTFSDRVHENFASDINFRATEEFAARARRELHLAMAKLEWADWLSGQLDRTNHNVMLNLSHKVDRKTGRYLMNVSFKGIDNDAAFPENRTGIYTFLDKDGTVLMDAASVSGARVGMLSGKGYGVRGIRKPIFLPLSVKKRIEALGVDDYEREMAPYLSDAALAAAKARFLEMKGAVADWPADCVIDDTRKTTDEMTDEEVIAAATQLDEVYDREYEVFVGQMGLRNADVAGCFYGFLMRFGA